MALSENAPRLNFCVMLIETKFRHLQIKDYIKYYGLQWTPHNESSSYSLENSLEC